MKKTITYFILFSGAIFTMIYAYTLMQVTQERQLLVFQNIMESAPIDDDFEPFVKYQSIAYEIISIEQNTDYSIHIYQVVSQDASGFSNQFVVFVVPHNEPTIANSLDDENDQTKIIIYDTERDIELIDSSTHEDYIDRALSYGLERVGFYYYVFFLNAYHELNITLFDYEGDIIYETQMVYNHRVFDPADETWLMAYTSDEISAMVNVNPYLRPVLVRRVTLFLIADIFIGAGIVFFIKYKKR